MPKKRPTIPENQVIVDQMLEFDPTRKFAVCDVCWTYVWLISDEYPYNYEVHPLCEITDKGWRVIRAKKKLGTREAAPTLL